MEISKHFNVAVYKLLCTLIKVITFANEKHHAVCKLQGDSILNGPKSECSATVIRLLSPLKQAQEDAFLCFVLHFFIRFTSSFP